MNNAFAALSKRFGVDEDKQENGVWVDFGHGIQVKIRRMKSRASQDARKELDKPHADVIRRGKLSEEIAEDLLIRQLAMGVIADWKVPTGGKDEDGNPTYLPNTFDVKYSALKELPDLRDAIFGVALEEETYRTKVEQEGEGNS